MRGIRNFFQAIGGGGNFVFSGEGSEANFFGILKFINLNFAGWGPACMMVSFQLIGIEKIHDS